VVISEKLGSAWTDYIFFGNQRIAQQTGSTLTVAKFLHQDHLGSTRVCTDGSGNSAGTCDYEPFGGIPTRECLLEPADETIGLRHVLRFGKAAFITPGSASTTPTRVAG